MVTITLKVNDRKYVEIKNFYAPYHANKKGEYLDFYAKLKTVTVTGYINKKNEKSIVFAGKDAEVEASIWSKDALKVKVGKDDQHVAKEDKKATALKKVDLANPEFKEEPTKIEKKITTKKEVVKNVAPKKEVKKPLVKKEEKKVAPKKVEEKKPVIKKTTAPKSKWLNADTQIGSDEVGVGDFLGPMIIVACFVKKENIKYLNELGVTDSKKLTDAKIREIAPQLLKYVDFSKLTLSNNKYNTMIFQDENLNSLKAKMHNRALLNMQDKHPEAKHIFIDQFVNEDKYYEYLNDEEERKVQNIVFQTKGESYYPAIAAASIIARYCFIQEMDIQNDFYKMEFPYGASSKVDEFSKKFIEKYGITEFNKIAKMNFANYKKAIQG